MQPLKCGEAFMERASLHFNLFIVGSPTLYPSCKIG